MGIIMSRDQTPNREHLTLHYVGAIVIVMASDFALLPGTFPLLVSSLRHFCALEREQRGFEFRILYSPWRNMVGVIYQLRFPSSLVVSLSRNTFFCFVFFATVPFFVFFFATHGEVLLLRLRHVSLTGD